MARRVLRTDKDRAGDIQGLCGSWGRTSTSVAIREIDRGDRDYYVEDRRGHRADVHVVRGASGKYLRSDPNSRCSDNLDSLPDC